MSKTDEWHPMLADISRLESKLLECQLASYIFINPTVHFIVCQTLFGDYVIVSCYFELKLTRYASTYFMQSGMKFQLDPTKDIDFLHILLW